MAICQVDLGWLVADLIPKTKMCKIASNQSSDLLFVFTG